MSDDLRQVRLEKLQKLRAQGVPPWPERFPKSHSLLQARSLASGTEGVRLAGRVVAIRTKGKLSFINIRDIDAQIQVAIQVNKVGDEAFKRFVDLVDLGDFVGVEGKIEPTKTGEQTLWAATWTFLGKALRDIPSAYYGQHDQELNWRERYRDLISNEAARKRFSVRTKVVKAIRRQLEAAGFDEVETPILCTHPSGALAKPFVSHHNSLDMEVFLRIAPETYLKRCIVAGYDKVYEFARCFRNEGMDPSHLQDFTMLEWYASYWNYVDSMAFTEKMIKATLLEVNGSLTIERGGSQTSGSDTSDGEARRRVIDFGKEWPRLRLRDLILEKSGIDIDLHKDAASLRQAIFAKKIDLENPDAGRGSLIDQLYKRTARPSLIEPTFIVRHPKDLSPLARSSDDDPNTVDRFQLVVDTWEVVNAYSGFVDPLDQRARLEDQAKQHAAGDEEAMVEDEDYLMAMEQGMPPISGFGMGIDRFVALLTDAPNLRDVVLFPLLRPVPVTGAPAPPAKKADGENSVKP